MRRRCLRAGSPGLAAAALLAAALGGCSRDAPQLAEVPPPPGLEGLDVAVARQYAERRQELQGLRAGEPDSPRLAAAYGHLGQWYLAYRFDEGAAVAYGNARALDPSEPRWPYGQAHALLQQGEVEEAAALLRRTLELAPRAVAPRVWLGELALQAGDGATADRRFTGALELDPRCVRSLVGRGKAALARSDFAAAAGYFEKAARLQPGAAEVEYGLGLAYRGMGEKERAAAALARVPAANQEQIRPALDDPWLDEVEALRRGVSVYQQRGQAAFRQGRFARAAEEFRQAVAEDPDNVEARINLSLALGRMGDVAAAEAALRRALAEAPGHARAHLALSGLLQGSGRPAEAATELRAALAADPDNKLAHFNLAQLLRRGGELAVARDHYATARRLDPRMERARFWSAASLIALGDAAAARDAVEEDLRQLPGDPWLVQLLARLLAAAPDDELRDGGRALDLASAGLAGGMSVSAAETFAMALAENGRFAEAAAWQRVAGAGARRVGAAAGERRTARRLALYRAGKPCRLPWESDEEPLAAPVTPPG